MCQSYHYIFDLERLNIYQLNVRQTKDAIFLFFFFNTQIDIVEK